MKLHELTGDVELKPVKEDTPNINLFYQKAGIKNPLVSKKADIKPLKLPKSFLFDIYTEKGGTYHFSAK